MKGLTRAWLVVAALVLSLAPAQEARSATVAIAIAGDISCARRSDGTSTCRDKATSDKILADSGVQYVLTSGDNQYENGTLSEYTTYYAPTWGRFKSRTHPSTGNHDHGSGYYDYWGSRAGARGKGYYVLRLGAWRVYALNSSIRVGTGSAQYKWLASDLAAHPARCVLAYWHHPRWSSSQHGSQGFMDPMWDLLYSKRADLVVAGHDHVYERFAPLNGSGYKDAAKGIRSFVVGTGGRSHYGFPTIARGSERRNNTSYGYLKLALGDGSYSWRFVPAVGSFTDSGTGTCH